MDQFILTEVNNDVIVIEKKLEKESSEFFFLDTKEGKNTSIFMKNRKDFFENPMYKKKCLDALGVKDVVS